jgi:hypothetical protein
MISPPDKTENRWVRAHREIQSAGRVPAPVMLGSSFAVAMGLFAWLGHRWDQKTGREPLGVLLGVAAGLVYGAYEVWKLTRAPPPSSPPAAPPDREHSP